MKKENNSLIYENKNKNDDNQHDIINDNSINDNSNKDSKNIMDNKNIMVSSNKDDSTILNNKHNGTILNDKHNRNIMNNSSNRNNSSNKNNKNIMNNKDNKSTTLKNKKENKSIKTITNPILKSNAMLRIIFSIPMLGLLSIVLKSKLKSAFLIFIIKILCCKEIMNVQKNSHKRKHLSKFLGWFFIFISDIYLFKFQIKNLYTNLKNFKYNMIYYDSLCNILTKMYNSNIFKNIYNIIHINNNYNPIYYVYNTIYYKSNIFYYIYNTPYYIINILDFMLRNIKFMCIWLYLIGIIFFIMHLKRSVLKIQFSQLAIIHLAIVCINIPCFLAIKLIYINKIWFIISISLVIINDISAYVVGKLIGKRQLWSLSPKKTIEGLIGASLCTFMSGYIITYYIMSRNLISEINMYIHILPFIFFASFVAPFGGFLASAYKRAFKLKDFSDTIPGHGGVTDRVDCQALMIVFTYVYLKTFFRPKIGPEKMVSFIIKNYDGNEMYIIWKLLGEFI